MIGIKFNIGYMTNFINDIKVGLEIEFNESGKPIIKSYIIR